MYKAPTPQEMHDMSQCIMGIREHTQPVFFSYYEGAINAGFDKEQAFMLTRDFAKLVLTGGDHRNVDPRSN